MQVMEDELKMLRSGVVALLHDTTPVPRANAQLRRFGRGGGDRQGPGPSIVVAGRDGG